MIMESPTVIVFGAMFLVGSHKNTPTAMAFLLMWMAHYVQRTFVYPFLLRGRKPMPLEIVVSAILADCMIS